MSGVKCLSPLFHASVVAALLIGSAMSVSVGILDEDQKREAILHAKADMGPALSWSDRDPVTTEDSEAADHIGEIVKVHGVVSDVHTNNKGIFIHLGGKSPNQLFTGFVPTAAKLASNSAFLKMLEGKEIAIRGKIKLYQTKPMVDVLLPVAQIMIKWKTAEEDPIDYLNGIVNDQYRRKLEQIPFS